MENAMLIVGTQGPGSPRMGDAGTTLVDRQAIGPKFGGEIRGYKNTKIVQRRLTI
jgi:hypothetical protein